MYLSRLILNPVNPDVQKDIADCHSLHRTILRTFPVVLDKTVKAREHFGVQFRVDTPKDGRLVLYVQSSTQPNWSLLKSGYLSSSDMPNPACRPVDTAFNAISRGMQLAFTLKANPTKKIGTSLKEDRLNGEKRSNGKRVFINTREAQMDWFNRKAQESGFIVLSVSLRECTAWGSKQKQGNLRFDGVIFQGYLHVTDTELFKKALRNGVGPGKAYGFGLLSVARPGGVL